MQDRPVLVRDSGSGMAMVGIIAVLVVAAIVALFVWQPWNTTGQHNSTTIITQPANPGAQNGAGAGANGGQSGSSSGSSNSSGSSQGGSR